MLNICSKKCDTSIFDLNVSWSEPILNANCNWTNLILGIGINKILKFSISKGGASVRDFQNTLGKTGNFQQFFYVYEQENKKCSRISCKGKIKKITISNRSSFYCSKCQNWLVLTDIEQKDIYSPFYAKY